MKFSMSMSHAPGWTFHPVGPPPPESWPGASPGARTSSSASGGKMPTGTSALPEAAQGLTQAAQDAIGVLASLGTRRKPERLVRDAIAAGRTEFPEIVSWALAQK